MRYGDSSIHITRWGTEGPVVAMVHGSAQGSRVGGDRHFAGQERLARQGWQIIVPDRPGHGRSPSPGRPDDVIADAEWVSDLLGKSAHLVGHSFGGAIALAAAARRPDAVRSLTLVEPALLMMAGDDPRVRTFIENQMALFSSKRPPQEIAAEFCRMAGIPPELRQGFRGGQEMTDMGKALFQMRIPPVSTIREYAEIVVRSGMPVQVVSGGWNPAFEATGDVAAKLTKGRRLVIGSSHHFPNLEHPEEFNDALSSFMTEADRALKRPAAGGSGN